MDIRKLALAMALSWIVGLSAGHALEGTGSDCSTLTASPVPGRPGTPVIDIEGPRAQQSPSLRRRHGAAVNGGGAESVIWAP